MRKILKFDQSFYNSSKQRRKFWHAFPLIDVLELVIFVVALHMEQSIRTFLFHGLHPNLGKACEGILASAVRIPYNISHMLYAFWNFRVHIWMTWTIQNKYYFLILKFYFNRNKPHSKIDSNIRWGCINKSHFNRNQPIIRLSTWMTMCYILLCAQILGWSWLLWK